MIQTSPLHINMLGEFTITYEGRTVNDQSSRSKKLWLLLEYLVAFRTKEISQNELIELLWPEDESDNPANTLKTLIHRVRSVLEDLGFENNKKLIIYNRGSYAWNPRLDCVVDVELFEEYCQKAGAPEITKEQQIYCLMAAIDLYKGDFLPKTALEPWAVPISTYYHAMYIKAVHDAIEIFFEAKQWDDILSLCQKAVKIDPYDEKFHYYLIKSLVNTDHQQAALQHYEYMTDLFYSKFGVNPSADLISLYKEIVKTSHSMELDLNIIRDGLKEKELSAGAFQCEYEIFKEIYQLQLRTMERNGQSIFVCLLTVNDGHGGLPAQKILNNTMDRLAVTIQECLRRGDVFTRYSISQYLIMLPTINYENAEMVMQRLIRTFRRSYPRIPVEIYSKSLPLNIHDAME